jgi:hypothetical protein
MRIPTCLAFMLQAGPMARTIPTARLALIKRNQIPEGARRASCAGEDLNSRSLAGDAGRAVPYRAPRSSARHTRDAGRCPRSSNPRVRRVQRHRNGCSRRHVQGDGDRAKYCAANKRCPDDNELLHQILHSVQVAGTEFCSISPRSFSSDRRDQFSASAVQRTRLVGSRFASCRHSAALALSSN